MSPGCRGSKRAENRGRSSPGAAELAVLLAKPVADPSPEPSPAGEIPSGGGPPPVVEGAVWPVVTLLIGGSIALGSGVSLTLMCGGRPSFSSFCYRLPIVL